MQRALLVGALAVASAACRTGRAQSAARAPDSPARNFEVLRLADGVYAALRRDRPGFMVDANNVFIIGERDVIVVDSNGAPSITREVVAALRRLTDKPVRFVINTHWHDDHIRGNSVYRDSFPGVDFIGHASMRTYMAGEGAENRRRFLAGAPGFLRTLEGLVAQGKSLAGGALSDEERASHADTIRLATLVLREGAGAQAVLPTIAVDERLRLVRGGRVIDILHLPGHTGGDLVVHLPRERIAIAGDLVVWPVPLVGDPQSHIGAWGRSIAALRALGAATIVPGHGPLLHDDRYLQLLEELFGSIARQTADAAARGDDLEAARKSVQLGDLRRKFAGDSPVRGLLFDAYAAGPAVAVGLREASPPPQSRRSCAGPWRRR
jgi:cyclase